MRHLLISFFLINFLWLSSQTTKQDSLEIYENTFRSLFKNNASYKKDKATFYYISIDDSLTSVTVSDLIKRLGDIIPKVKDNHEFQMLTVEEKGKIQYLSFQVRQIIISNDGKKASLGCGYYEENLSASGNFAILKKKRGKWRVIKNDIIWIS